MLENCVDSLLNCTYKALIRKVLKPRRSIASTRLVRRVKCNARREAVSLREEAELSAIQIGL